MRSRSRSRSRSVTDSIYVPAGKRPAFCACVRVCAQRPQSRDGSRAELPIGHISEHA